ncbi:MAG TPA: hypothetical protein VGO80_04155 [Solirubrobacteraceae bacterium]|nr:hypothetical protein [Solirubrobacteraceae bacterium]
MMFLVVALGFMTGGAFIGQDLSQGATVICFLGGFGNAARSIDRRVAVEPVWRLTRQPSSAPSPRSSMMIGRWRPRLGTPATETSTSPTRSTATGRST